jgi:carboxyl-terminal processing protease
VLAPVSFSMVNADGQGDYFGGLPVDCRAADDIGRELGDAAEASLAAALGYIRTGSCPVASQPLGTRRVPAASPPRAVGWAALVNAY